MDLYKDWAPWQYDDNLCVACEKYSETVDHFLICNAYKSEACKEWMDINNNNYDRLKNAGIRVEKRYKERKRIIENDKVGQAGNADSMAPGDC